MARRKVRRQMVEHGFFRGSSSELIRFVESETKAIRIRYRRADDPRMTNQRVDSSPVTVSR